MTSQSQPMSSATQETVNFHNDQIDISTHWPGLCVIYSLPGLAQWEMCIGTSHALLRWRRLQVCHLHLLSKSHTFWIMLKHLLGSVYTELQSQLFTVQLGEHKSSTQSANPTANNFRHSGDLLKKKISFHQAPPLYHFWDDLDLLLIHRLLGRDPLILLLRMSPNNCHDPHGNEILHISCLMGHL